MEWKWSGNGAQFVKIVWIGLDFGQSVDLKPYDRYRIFTKHDKTWETVLKIKNTFFWNFFEIFKILKIRDSNFVALLIIRHFIEFN